MSDEDLLDLVRCVCERPPADSVVRRRIHWSGTQLSAHGLLEAFVASPDLPAFAREAFALASDGFVDEDGVGPRDG